MVSGLCGTLNAEEVVKAPADSDRLLRAAGWFYLLPRAATGLLILAVSVLAGLLVVVAIALNVLRRFGG